LDEPGALPDGVPMGDLPVGAVAGDGSLACPVGYPVKGNPASLIYHLPGQASYDRLRAVICFASPEAAEAAGYRVSHAPLPRADGA